MAFVQYLRARRWPSLFGYLLFIGMMAAGYYYNLTFVQLGLVDLGERVLALSESQVAINMALFALLTCATGLLAGGWMTRQGWSQRFGVKLRMAATVVLVQTVLTSALPLVESQVAYTLWIGAASLALGVGVPATFGLTVDLVPVRDRGYVAAAITAIAYFAAAVFSQSWQVEAFRDQILPIMVAGTVGLVALAFARLPCMATLACQHQLPEFGRGRFVHVNSPGHARVQRSVVGLVVVMFAIYFIDSLGFLRLLNAPVYMNTAWQSPDPSIRLFIGGVHVAAALIAGILYANLDVRALFLWIFGIFALVHLMYGFHNRLVPGMTAPLTMPMLYATAVSMYTVVNFAIWADISTPSTVALRTAVGVALSGWTATFLSTSLAIRWRLTGMPLLEHLNIVDALAMICFAAMLLLVYLHPTPGRRHGTSRELP